MSGDVSGDPRELGGSIAGPGGPYERNAVVVDTRNAVLLDGMNVALVEAGRADVEPHRERLFAVELQGRVNRSDDRADVLYLTNADGLAGLVVELLAVASRAGEDLTTEVLARLEERLRETPT